MKRSGSCFLLFLFLPCLLSGQKIDNMASFREIETPRYFRINYDNDVFVVADENYTQGYNFEFVAPALKKNPVNVLLLHFENGKNKHGLSFESIGFTPKETTSEDIQFGDRPFAAAIMIKSFSISVAPLRKSRIVSSFNIGVIGPAALGDETQTEIHRATGNPLPRGWKHQIKNDLVLNYELSYEKLLLCYDKYFYLTSVSHLRLGTLFTNAATGINLVVGWVNNPFTSVHAKSKIQLYFYYQPMLSTVGYDATLQGGLFNNNSPYIISGEEVKRFTAQHNFGVVLQYWKLYFEYTRTEISAEFDSGKAAGWGGLRVGFEF